MLVVSSKYARVAYLFSLQQCNCGWTRGNVSWSGALLKSVPGARSSHDKHLEAAFFLALLKLHCGPRGPQIILIKTEVVRGRALRRSLDGSNVHLAGSVDLAPLALQTRISVPEREVVSVRRENAFRKLDCTALSVASQASNSRLGRQRGLECKC